MNSIERRSAVSIILWHLSEQHKALTNARWIILARANRKQFLRVRRECQPKASSLTFFFLVAKYSLPKKESEIMWNYDMWSLFTFKWDVVKSFRKRFIVQNSPRAIKLLCICILLGGKGQESYLEFYLYN
jgi:hypothetical protein